MADGGRRPCGDPVTKTGDSFSCWQVQMTLTKASPATFQLPKIFRKNPFRILGVSGVGIGSL